MNVFERDDDPREELDSDGSVLTYQISDDALEASAGSILMSGSSYPGVNCTGGCKR